jgi:hypothetical protein
LLLRYQAVRKIEREPFMRRIAISVALALLLAACGQPTASAVAAPAPEPQGAPVAPPPPPADPLAAGSQDAKDDLYCSALIYAENPSPPNALNPIDEAILRKAQALGFIIGESGINRLVAEKAAHATHGALIADAYAEQVAKDLAAKKPRLSLEACNARAEALPVPE